MNILHIPPHPRKHSFLLPMLLGCLGVFALPATAADHGRGHGERWHGDIRHFHEHDIGRWHGGHWVHGRHAGRSGWWWVVGTTWYWYQVPVYPYPDPYQPPVIGSTPPPAVAVPPQYWYYCANPPGYYPYVPQCFVNWQAVPASPP